MLNVANGTEYSVWKAGMATHFSHNVPEKRALRGASPPIAAQNE
jgi:hypothetical protein